MDYADCIECGKCTKSCCFLKGQNIHLKDFAQKPQLAYHCFLCGKCKQVCPVDIDGREIALAMRKDQVEEGYLPQRDGYGLLVKEKADYIFKNYKRAQSKTVLFPGCNFTAYFPKTTKRLSQMLWEQAGISTIYDCCGKPISELGLEEAERNIIKRMGERFEALGIEELLVLCPNCYYFFKEHGGFKVTALYERLDSLLPYKKVPVLGQWLFPPCPDRQTKELYQMLSAQLLEGEARLIDDIQCCGAGGCASVKEPEAAEEMRKSFKEKGYTRVYAYCATCCGMLAKEGIDARHVLCEALETDEQPAKGIKSLWNRGKFSLM